MSDARVLVVLDASAAWSRGILKGFTELAHEHGWTVLHYHPTADLAWLGREWQPSVAVLQPHFRAAVHGDKVSDPASSFTS